MKFPKTKTILMACLALQLLLLLHAPPAASVHVSPQYYCSSSYGCTECISIKLKNF